MIKQSIISVKAGIPYPINQVGSQIVISDIGGASDIKLRILQGLAEFGFMEKVTNGWEITVQKPFTGFEITSAVDTTINMIISDGDVRVKNESVTIDNASGNPVPVHVVDATLTVSSVTVNNTSVNPVPVVVVSTDTVSTLEQDASVITASSVNAGDTESVLLGADSTRRAFAVRNAGPNQAALIPAGTSFANAAIILEAGEIMEIDEAARAAWKCICATGLTAVLKVYAYTL